MKPTLVIFTDSGHLFAALHSDGVILGMWTRDALEWILEAYKPLVKGRIMEVICVSDAAKAAWEQTKTVTMLA